MSDGAPYNYSAATSTESLVFIAERPSYDKDRESKGAASAESIPAWVSFMKEHGIRRVFSALGDDEVEWYPIDIDAEMVRSFGEGKYVRSSVYADGAFEKALALVKGAIESKEPVVIHCSGGGGRASVVAAACLAASRGMTPEAAAAGIMEKAEAAGARRRVDVTTVQRFMARGTLKP
mmetsp:Transcript_8528/g.16677  ORF Transcript_8528/g.16677 Transcript_8528/m.16677 type:complete len:178 (-) Transcript_8528:1133-1666(-)